MTTAGHVIARCVTARAPRDTPRPPPGIAAIHSSFGVPFLPSISGAASRSPAAAEKITYRGRPAEISERRSAALPLTISVLSEVVFGREPSSTGTTVLPVCRYK